MTKKYEEIRDNIQTGDIVLFSGKGFVSSIIKTLTNCKHSHVGFAMRLPEYDTVLLWESTTLTDIRDIETGKKKKGVQLVSLSDRVKSYDGEVCIRHLENFSLKGKEIELMDFRHEVQNRGYEKDKIELLKSAYDGWFGENKEDLSSLFCSELVAEAYQVVGLLEKNEIGGKASNEYTPKDFSSGSDTKLLNGARLGKEIYLK